MNGGKAGKAAEEAGYAAPFTESTRLMANPRVQAALFAERERRISNLATLALQVQKNILSGKEPAPASVKAAVAESVLERAGHQKRAAAENPGNTKRLEDMTPEELDAFIEAGKVALAKMEGEMKDITPISPDDDE
jgi:hypothetical protein